MRALSIARAKRRQGKVVARSVPSPHGGWNTRDAKAAMSPVDAVILDNWFPDVGQVTTRKGYASHSTGLGTGAVETLAEYHAGGTRQLLAACDGAIFNSSSAGAATSLGTGFLNDRWSTVNFNSLLVMVNGEDTPRQWNGSALSTMTWSGSGLTPANLIGVAVFKNRLFFWEDDSQDFWYAPVDVVTGTLTKFPLSRLGKFGGKLVSISTWTIDSGEGLDDRLVLIMSSGQIIIYSGSDPGDASNWSLDGIYNTGEPVGHRAVLNIGGDLRIVTSNDYVSLTSILRSGDLGTPTKASGALQAAYTSASSLFGWDSVLFSEGSMALFNIPRTSTTFDQHVINTITGAWARFRDVNAYSWSKYNKELYFGGLGVVYKFWTGNDDAGSAIESKALQAWSDFGSPSRKRITGYKPVLETSGSLDYSSEIGFDFAEPRLTSPTTIDSDGTPWGSPWGSPWSPDTVVNDDWNTGFGHGVSVSPKIEISSLKEVAWLRTDYRAEIGTNL